MSDFDVEPKCEIASSGEVVEEIEPDNCVRSDADDKKSADSTLVELEDVECVSGPLLVLSTLEA